ncbi:methylamine dehydrogenase accessory protein MauD [Derxia gummosa]|uniref:Methylamine utilization protein MauD n=1 Tax=Derxia gummosa DSM 723 TaxID=1121388 RepID=A0A8B6X5K1_9BURK|nr:methylamine dehydrogenase accessory protein MauD [Derxia gummosa]
MTDALIISNLILWIALVAVVVVCLALARQIGILHERIAPMGALMLDAGPKVGDAAPRHELRTLDGRDLVIGDEAATGRATLLFFLSPTCPVCKKLLPIIKSVASREAIGTRVVLASDGEQPEHLEFVQRAGLQSFPYVLSTALGMGFHVSKLPYAVLIGADGRIEAKGLVNSREQLESLFTARELGVGSVQDYLARA